MEYRREQRRYVRCNVVRPIAFLLNARQPVSATRPHIEASACDFNANIVEAALSLIVRIVRNHVLVVELAADVLCSALQVGLRYEGFFPAACVLRVNLDRILDENCLHASENFRDDRDEADTRTTRSGKLSSRLRCRRHACRYVARFGGIESGRASGAFAVSSVNTRDIFNA